MYGDKHFAGNKYVVTQETEAYFNVMHKNYVLVDNSKQFDEFNEFKAYIDKFNDDSKLKAFRFLYKEVLKYYSIDSEIEHNKALGLHE